jgi:hypothetical protein
MARHRLLISQNLEAGETMNSHALETLTRRASLLTLGGAALATVARPSVSAASGTTFKDKLKKRCRRNKSRCVDSVTAFCGVSEQCIASVTPCCDECFSGAFFTCFLSKE